MVPIARVGTSGWMYDAWKAGWYRDVPRKSWLSFDAERFSALEADGTFYRLQTRETYERWAAQVPENFRFAIRGHRYTTHRKRLIGAPETVEKQMEPAKSLGGRLGAVLWQLPPHFRCDAERLRAFLEALRAWSWTRHAFEFRHDSWFVPQIAEMLAEHGVANTISHSNSFPMWSAVTTDFVYVRLHGHPHTYWSRYEDPELDRWSERIWEWLAEGRDVYAFFDNDADGHAPWDAMRLQERLPVPTNVSTHASSNTEL